MRNLLLIVPLLAVLVACNNSPQTLFVKIPASESGIDFNNKVSENDSINPLRTEFLYNGGGIALGDFNNDGLEDLYFTASMSPNRLYLNKGNFQFTDVTAKANVSGEGMWSNGATVVDINNDGLQDIYVSTTINRNPQQRRNLLYVNQGTGDDGSPRFREMAAAYGLADTSYSVQASFFDYDRDGDLDMYLVTTKPTSRNSYTFGNKKDSSSIDYDKLFRNDSVPGSSHPVFTDVSKASGIGAKGYGLAVTVSDLNNDGWPDIYVTNDFISSDHLYINNRNGTFTDRVRDCLKHTSQNAMGNDVSDINNDGWTDLVAVDMNPEDNFRKQKNMGAANYGKYRNMADYGYSLQFVRNTMQINLGTTSRLSDSSLPVFSDISYYAGVAETDWSWTPSLADFDNDGWKDLLITNGYPKDVTDHDYMSYRNDKGYIVSEKALLQQIPEIRVANYAFRNHPDLRFSNVSSQWGLDDKAYGSGAVYADLDNDGDLDYIINNINSTASLYRNTTDPKSTPGNGFIQIRFVGNKLNREGIGARVVAYYHGLPHVYEHYVTRGYLSSVGHTAHFGIDSLKQVDSILVTWGSGKQQKIGQTTGNQVITIREDAASQSAPIPSSTPSVFTSLNTEAHLDFVHTEYDFIDFDYQRLLPHKLSEYGPALASADVDGNGLDDIFVSGPKGKSSTFLLQQNDGSFLNRPLEIVTDPAMKQQEDMGALLIDIDNDGDPDLYLCSGSNEFPESNPAYRDRLFINDGKGRFTENKQALPLNLASKQVVKAVDFDLDGDPDLFIGSRNIPHQYPKPASGFLYRNDSQNGKIMLTDVTATLAPGLKNLGMITDAVWSDFNNDGTTDLVVCGEFMPLTFFAHTAKGFVKTDAGVNGVQGLWNSIVATDLNNDGNMDYVAGNLGLNSFYKGTDKEPFSIYGSDYDRNGSFDAIPFLFLNDQQGKRAQYPAFTRDDLVKQMTRIKGQFPTYKSFATASLDQILTRDEQQLSLHVTATYMESAVFINNGKGRFNIRPLPPMAQWSPVYGMLADDYNNDGYIDLLVNTNDLGTEVNTGQYDALNGLLLSGDGKGNFSPQPILSAGFFVPSNGKAIINFTYQNHYAVAVSQNKGPLLLFGLTGNDRQVAIRPSETHALLMFANGSTRKEEFSYGNTYLSQGSRMMLIPANIRSVSIMSGSVLSRQLTFK